MSHKRSKRDDNAEVIYESERVIDRILHALITNLDSITQFVNNHYICIARNRDVISCRVSVDLRCNNLNFQRLPKRSNEPSPQMLRRKK